MIRKNQRIYALLIIVVASSVALYLLNRPQANTPATITLVQMPSDDLTALASSVHEHLGVTDWPPLSPTSVDVAHMHGSWVYGEVLALRLNGIRIDPASLGAHATGDQIPDDIHEEFQDDDPSPEWLRTPWIDSDGSYANWASAKTEAFPGAVLIWYVRPQAHELILYLKSNDEQAISDAMKNILTTADYVHIQSRGSVGDDWKKWAGLRFSPIN